MSYSNFIPTVWNEAINRELERLCVFVEDCNRRYEGDVKKKGEAVTILGVGKPTIKDISRQSASGDIDGPEEIEDTSVIMYINQIRYFNYMIGDIDKAQSVAGVMDALSAETSEGIANAVDKYISGLVLDSGVKKLYTSAPKLVISDSPASGEADVLDVLDSAIQKLYENDVKPGSEITLTVPPWFYMMMKRAYEDLDTDNSTMLKNGKMGTYAGATIKMSNNVAVGAGGSSLIQVKTNKAIAFVNPMTHTEAYRPEKSFSDAVKGFILFDAKIVRPKEMIILNCNH